MKYAFAALVASGALIGASAQAAPVTSLPIAAASVSEVQKVDFYYGAYRPWGYYPAWGYRPYPWWGHRRFGYGYGYGYRPWGPWGYRRWYW